MHAPRVTFEDKTYLLICGGTGCHATGSLKVKEALAREIAAKQLEEKVEVIETGCNGFCAMGPIMVVHPGNIFYQKIQEEDIAQIVTDHLMNGKPVEKLLYKDPGIQENHCPPDGDSFFRPPDAARVAQQRVDRP